jgi:hypothetical protein
LARLAKEGGSRSIVKQLRKRRAQDYQVYAFRVGGYYVIGRAADALAELAIFDPVAARGG